MLGYKKGQTKELCGQMPLHYPADRVYRHGDTDDDVDTSLDGSELNRSAIFSTTAVGGKYYACLGYFSKTPTLSSVNVLGVGDTSTSDFSIGTLNTHNYYVSTTNSAYVGKAIYMVFSYS